jgi:hypothetical protein
MSAEALKANAQGKNGISIKQGAILDRHDAIFRVGLFEQGVERNIEGAGDAQGVVEGDFSLAEFIMVDL